MADPTSNKRVSSPPASIDIFFQPSPPRFSIDDEAVNVKKNKRKKKMVSWL